MNDDCHICGGEKGVHEIECTCWTPTTGIEDGEAKEKALQLFTDFAIYDWDDNKGYTQNERETKSYCNRIIDELYISHHEILVDKKAIHPKMRFWQNVRRYLNNI